MTLLEDFLGSVKSGTSVLNFPPHHSLKTRRADLPTRLSHCLGVHIHQYAFLILLRPPIAQNGHEVVQEYQPVVHRLRLSASA